jgi:hypothetical protein
VLGLESAAHALGPEFSRDRIPAAQKMQQEVRQLKSEALLLYCKGELEGADLMAQFLVQANEVGSYLGRLIFEAARPLGGPVPASCDGHFEPPSKGAGTDGGGPSAG